MIVTMMMIECIAEMMCGAVRSRPGGPVEQVVAAGGINGSTLSTVEIYGVESNTWKKGQLLLKQLMLLSSLPMHMCINS